MQSHKAGAPLAPYFALKNGQGPFHSSLTVGSWQYGEAASKWPSPNQSPQLHGTPSLHLFRAPDSL